MPVLVTIIDQVPGTRTTEGPRLTFEVGTVTAREIIRARVLAEVDRYNSAEAPRTYTGLVAPAPEEFELNGAPRAGRKPLDAEAQIAVALDAARSRRVIMIFNGLQVEDLDQPLLVTPVSEARFIKLVPLVGG
jgi:hypothetical protein